MVFYVTVDVDSIRPYMPAVPVLLPASSFARKGLRPPRLPAQITECVADSGGFVATRLWGDYRYTPAQYVDWLSSWHPLPRWAATMDYCCEPEIATNNARICARQERTTEMAWHFWQTYRQVPWCWVPTIQGWTLEQYVAHARALSPLIHEMQRVYQERSGAEASAFRVGIGTLCHRASTALIHAVTQAVAAELPGVPLHLWGVKLTTLQSPIALPAQVVSTDSAAWNGLAGWQERQRWHTYRDRGYTQRQYSYFVALPEYLKKIARARTQPKLVPLEL